MIPHLSRAHTDYDSQFPTYSIHTHTVYVYIYYQSTDRHTGKKTEKECTY